MASAELSRRVETVCRLLPQPLFEGGRRVKPNLFDLGILLSPRMEATPGIDSSSRTRLSERAKGTSSGSSGASRRSRWSTSATASQTERRQAAGTAWDSSNSTASGSRGRASERRRRHRLSKPKLPFLAEERSRIRCARRLSCSLKPAPTAKGSIPPAPARASQARPARGRRPWFLGFLVTKGPKVIPAFTGKPRVFGHRMGTRLA
jgi:hypothetical protein